jgi:putative ABC transport system permease protein
MRFSQRFFRRALTEKHLDAELRFHLEQQIADYIAAGMTPEEAGRRARLEFGGLDQVKEGCREVGATRLMETLIQDLRYGLRQLRRSPGFTAVAVATLALGIGANTAIFSVVSAVLLRPLPFPAPERLVRVMSMRLHGGVSDNASYPDFADWRARNHVFAHLAAFNTDSFTLTGQGEAAHVQGAIVSADLFSLLGVKPILGRTFLPDEDKLSATTEGFPIIISHRLWRERFGRDSGIVGRSISLDNRSFIVVGVMPAGFQFPLNAEPMDFWTTMAIEFVTAPGLPSMAEQRGAHYLDVIARLKPGVSISQAQAEMSTIVSALNKQYPENSPRGIRIMPELDRLVGDVRLALLILLAAVGCVLLIACANVANLLLARGTGRQKEMAIRGALGAARVRIIRQLLTESVMLAALGGTLGAAVALWGIPMLIRLVPQDIPRLADVRLDASVLLFTSFLSLLTGVLFGLAPAMQASHSNFAADLKESARRLSGGPQRDRIRSLLVIGDVAIAAVLLVGAGLLIQSFWRLQRIPPGFDPHRVLTFKIDLPYIHYPGLHQSEFFQQAVTRLGQLPGVRSASAVLPLPLDGEDVGTMFDIDGEHVSEANQPRATYSWAEPGYFRTVGIPLLQGRDFADADDLKARPVVIINQTLARRFFPDQNPLGRRIKPGIGNGYSAPPMREIVGVVGDVKQKGLTAEPDPQVYVPLAQSPLGSMIVVMRTEVDPSSMVAAARNVIAGMDKDLPISGVRTLDDYLDHSVAQPHFFSLLLGMFAALALALAAVGLYGVVSYAATQRTHEIGVRMALGAERKEVIRLVVAQGFKLTLMGIALGIAGAFLLTRFLSSLLYGVTSTDPSTFVAVSLLLAAVALLASYMPARRAAQVDPMVALRHE